MHISGIRPCVVFYEHSINKNQDKENHQVMQLTASDSTYKRKVLDGELANLDVEWAINSMKTVALSIGGSFL